MQIYCPKCNAGYEIDEILIADKERRVKCSACGEVFEAANLKNEDLSEADIFAAVSAAMAEKEQMQPVENIENSAKIVSDDNQPEEPIVVTPTEQNSVDSFVPEISDEIKESDEEGEPSVADETILAEEESVEDEPSADLEKIFERLSEHTEHLIEAEKKLPFYEKFWLQVKNVLGFHFKIKWSYIIIALAFFVALSAYNNRYQIVRKVPFLNGVYKVLGIKAKIPGEGLEFQNIGWDYVKDDEGVRLIVKGFVYNPTERRIALPIIHIEILDKEIVLLQSHNREIASSEIDPHAKVPLNLQLANTAPTAKYIYLTFIDKD